MVTRVNIFIYFQLIYNIVNYYRNSKKFYCCIYKGVYFAASITLKLL